MERDDVSGLHRAVTLESHVQSKRNSGLCAWMEVASVRTATGDYLLPRIYLLVPTVRRLERTCIVTVIHGWMRLAIAMSILTQGKAEVPFVCQPRPNSSEIHLH